jgi:hypothetical protein
MSSIVKGRPQAPFPLEFPMTATTPRLSLPDQEAPELAFTSRPPVYGDNYAAGYVGFTYTASNLISRGITYVTRWTRMHQIKVSHALIVSGENECIEAHAKSGVRRAKLSEYFDDEQCQIFFRKPVGLNPELAGRVISTAAAQVGCEYDIDLILAQLESNSLTGNLLRRMLGKNVEETLCRLKDHPDRWICSELVAHCLDEQPEFHDKGVLKASDASIDPQELFEDDLIFTAWHK